MLRRLILCAVILTLFFLSPSDAVSKKLEPIKTREDIMPTLCKIITETTISVYKDDDPANTKTEYYTSEGSGVFIDNSNNASFALILTASHLVTKNIDDFDLESDSEEKKEIKEIKYKIIPYRNQSFYYSGIVVCNEPDKDLAVMRGDIPPQFYKIARVGNSDKLTDGDDLYLFGNPDECDSSGSKGIVSGFHRILSDYISDFIQTDAHINPGSSGGPVFNSLGELIGIAISVRKTHQGIGFIAPINLIPKPPYNPRNPRRLTPTIGCEALLRNFPRSANKKPGNNDDDFKTLKEIMNLGDTKISRTTERKLTAILAASENHGAIVTKLYKFDGAFDYGDIITELNGIEIKDGMQMRIILSSMKSGDKVNVNYKRIVGGKIKDLSATITLKDRP